MQFNLITANTTLEGQRRLYARVNAQDCESARHIFIVPDRYTLSVEQDICRFCFPDGYTRADVVSFTRLAVKTVGRKIKKCLSKEGTVILLNKVMKENEENLKYYKKLTGYGFAKETFAAMASLRSSGITPEVIEAKLGELDGVIRDKLSDMAVIMREYERELLLNFSDTITRIDALKKYLQTEGLGGNVHVYISGFNFYSAQQLEIIKALLKSCESVSIPTVPIRGALNAQMTEVSDFCKENGINVDIEEAYERVKEPFETVRRFIFTGKREEKAIKNSEDIRLFSEQNPYEEAMSVAREIIFLTRRKNYRFKDIAVVCNDINMLPVIRETFERTGVPLFIDEGYRALDGVAVRYILNVMRAAESYKPADIFRVVGHPLFGLDGDCAQSFERYCVKYNVRYRRFFEPFTLGDATEAEGVRQRLMSLLISLPESAEASAYCDWFADMLASEGVVELLTYYSESEDERLRASAYTDDIERLLNDIKMLVGGEKLNLSGFISLFSAAAADLKITLRPDCVDSVFVGGVEESRFSKVKALFILNATDGQFPILSGDGLIFTATDNESMRRHGLSVYPSPIEKNEFERFIVRDLLSKPSERLYIGCAETDLSGEVQNCGDGFAEIKYITSNEIKPLDSYHGFDERELINYRLASLENAYYMYVSGRVPDKYASAVRQTLVKCGRLKESAVQNDESVFERIFKKDEEGNFLTSVSQLETYFACPFKHFLRYGVKVQPDEDSVLRSNTLGNIFHNVLEWFFKNRLGKIYSGENLDKDILYAVERELIKEEYERYFTDPISAHMLIGVKKECIRLIYALAANMRESDFRPMDIEVGFGYRKDDNLILIDVDNRKFSLRGKIDRVDKNGEDVVIIDYKSGAIKPELKEVACGNKIQLYIYLSYYIKRGYRPAGVFYLPIKKSGGYAMLGQIRDGEVFKALDRRALNAEGKYDSPAVGIGATVKNGEVKFNARNGNILTEEDFSNATEYVERLVKKALGEILEGYAEKKPTEGECQHCEYKKICGEVAERKKPTGKMTAFFENALNAEEETDGALNGEAALDRIDACEEKTHCDDGKNRNDTTEKTLRSEEGR